MGPGFQSLWELDSELYIDFPTLLRLEKVVATDWVETRFGPSQGKLGKHFVSSLIGTVFAEDQIPFSSNAFTATLLNSKWCCLLIINLPMSSLGLLVSFFLLLPASAGASNALHWASPEHPGICSCSGCGCILSAVKGRSWLLWKWRSVRFAWEILEDVFFPFFMAFGLLVSLLKLGEELAEGRGKLRFFFCFLLGGDCVYFLPEDVGTGWLPPAPQGWAALAWASALPEAGAKGLGLVLALGQFQPAGRAA